MALSPELRLAVGKRAGVASGLLGMLCVLGEFCFLLPDCAGLDYFVLELLVLGLVFVPLESLFALHDRRIFRDGWQTDLKHFFVSHAGVQLLSFAAMIPAQAMFAWAVRLDFQQAVAAQPVWLQLAEMILAIDLMTYWTWW